MSPQFPGGRNTTAIRGKLEAISDRKKGGDPNLRSVQSRGQGQGTARRRRFFAIVAEHTRHISINIFPIYDRERIKARNCRQGKYVYYSYTYALLHNYAGGSVSASKSRFDVVSSGHGAS